MYLHCVNQYMAFSNNSHPHPAIINIPPSGVIGPRNLNLESLLSLTPCVLATFFAYLPRPNTSVMILPENTSPPIAMAGPANRCAENLGCSEISSNASPL